MRKIIFACAFLCAFACNQQASKTEVVATSKDSSTALPAKGTVDFEGPEIDLMKKLLSSVEKGDWESANACFADSAVVFANTWAPDTSLKGVPVREVLAQEKADRPKWENVSYGDPIYEVITTPTGEKYGHIWVRYTAKEVNTKKKVDATGFLSYLIKDGKLQWEWIVFDSKAFE